VILSGSQAASVRYMLKINGVGVDPILTGTGSALDFGPQTIPGTYTVSVGAQQNISASCSVLLRLRLILHLLVALLPRQR